MIPISLLVASKYSYSDIKLPYHQYIDVTEIPDEVLFLYDNSINISNSNDYGRYNDQADILRWQVETYKSGAKPEEFDEQLFAENVPRKLITIKEYLVEIIIFRTIGYGVFLSNIKSFLNK
jgi:hypothetical protein